MVCVEQSVDVRKRHLTRLKRARNFGLAAIGLGMGTSLTTTLVALTNDFRNPYRNSESVKSYDLANQTLNKLEYDKKNLEIAYKVSTPEYVPERARDDFEFLYGELSYPSKIKSIDSYIIKVKEDLETLKRSDEFKEYEAWKDERLTMNDENVKYGLFGGLSFGLLSLVLASGFTLHEELRYNRERYFA